jgi:hypothetical protein
MSTVATVLVLVVAILGGSAHAKDLSPQQKKDAVAAAWSAEADPSRRVDQLPLVNHRIGFN